MGMKQRLDNTNLKCFNRTESASLHRGSAPFFMFHLVHWSFKHWNKTEPDMIKPNNHRRYSCVQYAVLKTDVDEWDKKSHPSRSGTTGRR
jgi:hypothetical protein